MKRYRRPTAVPLALGLLAGSLLAYPVITTAATNTGGATISAQLKADNPQAVQFENNGVLVKSTENVQINSDGFNGMHKAMPSWMGGSGVYLDRARHDGLYVPGKISYMHSAKPHVVLALMGSIAEIFQSSVGGINDPTLIVPANRPVKFTVMDFSISDPGTFTVVRKAPPYTTFIKLSHESLVFDSGWITRTPMSGAYSPYRTVTYTFTKPGTYYYLSMQPGNAAGGQWGKIIVKLSNSGGAA
ncbi:hypothetical protein [Acidihalobacter ferrooxydans]|uniref:Rusticyanin n=1 Tax=Acidihalobacter ferrooxydans TaxID=1765967 RepID=A0A1P8UDM7_9GAMM|nr:hypothetical protein [Acidihalobacter ferrooxydans]APZ41945.1 hypothetical protein BW247_01565 [Acidihalobacter ferrooxydans]